MVSRLADRTFWHSFTEEYWNKKPGVFKDVLSKPLVTEVDILSDIRRIALLLNDGIGLPVRLFIDGRMIQGGGESLQFIPQGNSLSRYAQDLSETLGGRSFGLVLNNYDKLNSNVWMQIRQAVVHIVDQVGLPSRDIQCVLFVGNYQTTPMGIHIDRATNVLSFGVHGSKRMLAWPHDYFDNRDGAKKISRGPSSMSVLAEPDPFQKDATIMEYGPGDVAYWPESYWHCVHQQPEDEHVHVSVNLTFRSNERLSDLLSRILATTLSEQLGKSNDLYNHWKNMGEELPTEIEAGLYALEQAVSSGEIRKRAEKFWMNQYRI